jgi:hypothetical protein
MARTLLLLFLFSGWAYAPWSALSAAEPGHAAPAADAYPLAQQYKRQAVESITVPPLLADALQAVLAAPAPPALAPAVTGPQPYRPPAGGLLYLLMSMQR